MDQSAVPKDLPMEQVYRIANSEAGKNLIKLLQSKNSPQLSDAARLAVSGNAAQAKSALSGLLADPEIQALLKQLGG